MRNIFRRLRGALGNALVWGATWFLGSFAVGTIMYLAGAYGSSFRFWELVPRLAANFGMMGVLAGGAFSTYLGFAARERRLHELRPGRFGLFGGLIAGLLVPTIYFGLSIVLGAPGIPLRFLVTQGLVAAVFGGGTALGTIKIAQNALAPGEERHEEPEPGPERLLPDPEAEALQEVTRPRGKMG